MVSSNLKTLRKSENMDKSENEKYEKKYKKMKRTVKDQVYLNAALHDEVLEIEQKLIRLKQERKLLLKKLFEYLPMTEAQCVHNSNMLDELEKYLQNEASEPTSASKQQHEEKEIENIQTSSKSINSIVGSSITSKTEDNTRISLKRARPALPDGGEKSKRKRARSSKKRVQPLHMDELGAPIFPITLGTLTVYDLGEVIHEKPGFHSERYIWPVGYCSTRSYPSMIDPERRVTYFCYIKNAGNEPVFEIIPEDEPDKTFSAVTATAAHCHVLKRLNKARGKETTNTGSGPEFFGFSHPTVQYMIQCLPSADKCSKYIMQEYEFPQRTAATVSSNVIRVDNKPNMAALDRTKLELPNPAKNKSVT